MDYSAMMTCEALQINNTISKCRGCRILNVDSHEYQMEGFVYTCVILLFYLLLTTVFMVKIISPKSEGGKSAEEEAEQKRFVDTRVLKKFRDREKKKTRDIDIRSRQEIKKQMITYLQHMQTSSGGEDSGISFEQKDESQIQQSINIPEESMITDPSLVEPENQNVYIEAEIECDLKECKVENVNEENGAGNTDKLQDTSSENSAEYFV